MAPQPSKTTSAGLEPFGGLQLALYHETAEDAARALGEAYVGAEGRGLKALAARLRPTLPVDKAHRWFLAAVNNERDEKFSGADWLTLMRIGREIGVHTIAHHFNTEAGYEYRVLSGDEAKARARAKKTRKAALLAELSRLMEDDE